MAWQEKLNTYLTPRRQRFVLVGLLVLYGIFLARNITAPFIGTSEAFNGMYGIAAANWLYHGPAALKFAEMTPNGGEGISPEITKVFYLDHPQFFIAPAALSYWLFGIGDWQTRLGPIIFSLLSLIAFWSLIKRVFRTPSLTAISSVFYIFFPIGIYYGRMLTQEPITLFFVLALFWATIAFEQEQKGKYLVFLSVAAFLGGLMDWEFFFAAAAAFGYIALKHNYPKRGTALLLVLGMSAASLGVTLLQIWGVTNVNPLAFLYFVFMDRASAFKQPQYGFLLFLLMRGNFDLIDFSEVALVLAAIGAAYYALAHKKDKGKLLFAAVLAAPGILTYVVFYGHAFNHQFIGFYFIPPVAFMAAWGLCRLRRMWLAGAVLAVFMASSAWYAVSLLSYKSFAPDDFTMLKRVNAAVPISEPICMGELQTNMHIKFYLFAADPLPHTVDNSPCPNDRYFVLQRPESFAIKDPSFSLLQTFLTYGFWANLHRVSFLAASAMEAIKSVPPLKQKIEGIFAKFDPHASYRAQAERIQNLIDSLHLRPIDCSTYFCLYKKSQNLSQ